MAQDSKRRAGSKRTRQAIEPRQIPNHARGTPHVAKVVPAQTLLFTGEATGGMSVMAGSPVCLVWTVLGDLVDAFLLLAREGNEQVRHENRAD